MTGRYFTFFNNGRIILTVLLLLLSFPAITQPAVSRLGIRAGVNNMGILFDPVPVGKSETSTGYEAGIVFQHLAERNLGIQLNLSARQLNWQHRQDSLRYFTLKQHDIDFTASTYIYFATPKSSFFLHLGPAIGYTLSSENQTSGSEPLTTHFLANRTRKRFFYGLTAGAGVTQKIAGATWQLEGSFSQRLTNLFQTRLSSSAAFSQIMPNAFSVSLTYFFYSKRQ